jgi:uncharacterized membrane protein
VIWRRVELQQAGVLLAGSSLLAGTLLASFGQVATLRARVQRSERGQIALDALDETVAHILMAVYAAVLLAGVLAVATSVTEPTTDINRVVTAIALTLGAWLLLLVLLVVPRLYMAYTYAFDVREELDGHIGQMPARFRTKPTRQDEDTGPDRLSA